MSGFVGARAKRRKRNIISIFLLILVFFLFLYIISSFKLTEIVPSNTLLPSVEEINSPEINLTIEELQFKLFDRDQKIIFRNNEIKKFKDDLTILIKENTQLSNSIQNLTKKLPLVSSKSEEIKNINEQLEETKKNNKRELQRLNNIILKITNEKNSLIKSKELSKKEYKIIISKNMRLKLLKDSLEEKIKKQIDVIDELNLSIQILKDSYHHR